MTKQRTAMASRTGPATGKEVGYLWPVAPSSVDGHDGQDEAGYESGDAQHEQARPEPFANLHNSGH